VQAVELQSLKASDVTSLRAFPATEPSTSSSSSSSPVVVINFSKEGCPAPVASLIVVQVPVGDALAATVAAELARGVAESLGAGDPAAAAARSVLLLAALRLPQTAAAPRAVFWGGNHEGFSKRSGSSSEILARDARISDGFVSALALALSLSLSSSSSSSTASVALAAVDGHRPAVVPFSASTPEAKPDAEALEAASALGEAAAEALGQGLLAFSRERAQRLVPSRTVLLEAASLSAKAKAAASAAAPSGSAAAPAAPMPLLQGAEQMYG